MNPGDRCRLYFEDRPADLYYTVVATKDESVEVEAVDGERFVIPAVQLTTEDPLPMSPENRVRWETRRRVVADAAFRRERRRCPGGKYRRSASDSRALFAREAAAAASWRS